MPSDLWSFANACYARPGVEAICLRLQEQGVDVCLLLCALWLERRGAAASEPRLQQLQAISLPWQRDVVRPLRELRQSWRTAAADDPQLTSLRERIKVTELEAEQELLRRLERLTENWAAPARAQECAWLELLSEDRDALHRLRAAADLP
ncbi:TIGR02444 family protein [Pseudomonas sp. BMS12]|uniref:TIGR02444 family protein n=1 Tax=Pseudomonas sp. BMS12 TaxID=1796033 RepID=UPI00083AFBA2|nr:TIGR02444 family protein [Pseudomonas sp. BMS12]